MQATQPEIKAATKPTARGNMPISPPSSIATIFIPYPYAAADHQRKNAKYMVEHGAGLYLENEDTTPETLKKDILQLLENKNELHQIQENATKLAKFDGVQKIVEQLK